MPQTDLLGKRMSTMNAELCRAQNIHIDLQYKKTSLEQSFDAGLEAFTVHINALPEEQRSRLESALSDYTT